MKKFLCIIASITLLFCAVGCKTNEVDLHKESMNITALMEMKAKSEDYWQLSVSGTRQSFEEDRAYFIASDYDHPIRCYRITKPDSDKCKDKLLFKENEQEQFNNLPDELKTDLTKKYSDEKLLFQYIISYLQHFDFDNHLASVCNTTKIIEKLTIEEPIAYLYIFETGKPIVVLFTSDKKNSTTAQGFFLPNSEYKTLSETRDIFEPYGCTVEIEFEGSTYV